jgi:RNA polymerase sigma-70 factor (ECF subfamily)
MSEDRSLVRRFNAGDPQALRRIYEMYRLDLFRVAGALLHDPATVEDVVHDVFVGFASQAGRFELKGSLKGYLAICVANRARNLGRQNRPRDWYDGPRPGQQPDTSQLLVDAELHQMVRAALTRLPAEQHDAIVLHVVGSLRFREIARQSGESINTVKSRYSYGMAKLRSLLNGQLEQ